MIAPVFVDTNVLICSRDASDPVKAAKASDWLRMLGRNGMVVSPQVLNEAFAVSRSRFGAVGLEIVSQWVRSLEPNCTAPLDARTVDLALDIHREHGLPWWDCPIVASALMAGCRYLLSEDMQHRQAIRTVRIIDPFRAEPADILE